METIYLLGRKGWDQPYYIRRKALRCSALRVLAGLNTNQRTYQIRKLVEAGMLQPTRDGARQYTIGFANNMLLRGVVKALTDEGFIPPMLAAPVPSAREAR